MIDYHSKRADAVKWIVVVFGIIIRFWRLGGQSLWADEIITIGMYKSPPPGISYFRKVLWDVHGPFYSLILHFWSMVSSSEFWLRTPSALAGGISIWALYKWLKRITDERIALTGALFLAINPFSLYYSQELRFYSMLNLFVILSLLAFNKFELKPNIKSSLILGVVLGATCLTHFSAVFLLAGFTVYMAVSGRLKGGQLRFGLLAAIIVLSIVSPWIYREFVFLRGIEVKNIANFSAGEKLRGDLTLNIWSYPYIIYAFSTGYSFGPSLRELHFIKSGMELIHSYGIELILVYLIFGGMCINGFVRLRKIKNFSFFLIIPATVILCLTLIALFNLKVFNVRYLVTIFPVFIAILAAGVPKKTSGAVIVIFCAASVMLISDFNYLFNDKYARDDIRGAAKTVSINEEEGDSIILMGVYGGFKHYYNGNIEEEKIFSAGFNQGLEDEKILRVVANAERVWFIICREWNYRPKHSLEESISPEMKKTGSWKFSGVKVFIYERAPEYKTISY